MGGGGGGGGSFPGFLGQFGHGAGGFADSSGDFSVKAQVHGDGGTEVGEFVDYIESVVADSDYRGLASDIMGTRIGFLEAGCQAKVFTYAGEFVDEPLHCSLGVCCQGFIVSEEHVTHKNSFDFGLGTETSHIEEFTVGAGMKVHNFSGRDKGMRQEEREEDSTECPGLDAAFFHAVLDRERL